MVTHRHSLQVQSMLGQCLHPSPQGRRIDDHMLFCLCLRGTVVASYRVRTESGFSLKVELGPQSLLAACLLLDQFMSSKAVYIVFQFC